MGGGCWWCARPFINNLKMKGPCLEIAAGSELSGCLATGDPYLCKAPTKPSRAAPGTRTILEKLNIEARTVINPWQSQHSRNNPTNLPLSFSFVGSPWANKSQIEITHLFIHTSMFFVLDGSWISLESIVLQSLPLAPSLWLLGGRLC